MRFAAKPQRARRTQTYRLDACPNLPNLPSSFILPCLSRFTLSNKYLHYNSSSRPRSQYATSTYTLVCTTTGVKPVRDIQIGDYLYDAANRPALCIGVSQPATGALKKITRKEFDSSANSSFTCTPAFRLSLTPTNTTPSLNTTINAVQWFTRCDRTYTLQADGDLQLDTDFSMGTNSA
ncbi:hypothetical protein V1522DRAFT_64706 [Lipomyces starkeyi]